MVTTIKFRRPLQTNEPINDMAIPTDGYVSVIGAIGPLNSRREANAHSHDGMSVNSDDIRIDFSSKVDHTPLLLKTLWTNFNSFYCFALLFFVLFAFFS